LSPRGGSGGQGENNQRAQADKSASKPEWGARIKESGFGSEIYFHWSFSRLG
jgi:hypothetical protein